MNVLNKSLLAGGILSSMVYVAANVAGALSWKGYDSASRAVSELSGIGAPSRPVMIPLLLAYALLALAFGIGVYRSGKGHRNLRRAGLALILIGVVDLTGPLFPMNAQESVSSFTNRMHIALTAATVLLILLAMVLAVGASGKIFRIYSYLSIFVLVLFGVLAGMEGPNLASHEPTPWIGVTERINIGSYLLWQAILAIVLLRVHAGKTTSPATR